MANQTGYLTLLLKLTFFFCLVIQSVSCWSQSFPDGFNFELIAENLNPTQMTFSPDGRLFISEKNGVIRVVENDVLQQSFFLDMEVQEFNESGLMGIAFHPEFEVNNWLYVYYKAPGTSINRVSRFTANGPAVLPGSEEVLLELNPSGSIHNGGSMKFLSDGTLIIGVGDGGLALTAQNTDYLLGKVLRMNDDGTIPSDNPFVDQFSGVARYIYSIGLRNPFGMDVLRSSDLLFINDVGQGDFEEINQIASGANYGWNTIEGPISTQTPPQNYQDPVFAYSHADGCAITAGAFYQGSVLPFPSAYQGKYFFADYCQGYLKVLDPTSGSLTETFATGLDRPVGLAISDEGELYYLERSGIGGGSSTDNTNSTNGRLWKLTYSGSGAPFIGQHPQSVLAVVSESVSFEVVASGAENLSYTWFMNSILLVGQEDAVMELAAVALADDGSIITCVVSNDQGTVTSNEAVLSVTNNQRPLPQIDSPQLGSTYIAGAFLPFSGSATDNEDGALAEDDLDWRIDFHHNEHTHPAMSPLESSATGSFLIPTIGETSTNVWYRIHLTATDSEGLSRSVYTDVYPELTSIDLETAPAGLQLVTDGQFVDAPASIESVVGMTRTFVAPILQEDDSHFFAFEDWGNGQTSSSLTVEPEAEDLELTANYSAYDKGQGVGLIGSYYLLDASQGEEALLTRLDSVVNFNWGDGVPDESVPEDEFKVSWEGYVESIFPGTYTFYLLADEGARLYVNHEEIIDSWEFWSQIERSATVEMEASTQYHIRLEYQETTWNAAVKLAWSHHRIPYQVIPSTQLNPERFPDVASTDASIKIVPNPVTDVFQVRSVNRISEINIVDSSGRKVKPNIVEVTGYTIYIKASNLSTGLYFVQILTSEGYYVSRLLVE